MQHDCFLKMHIEDDKIQQYVFTERFARLSPDLQKTMYVQQIPWCERGREASLPFVTSQRLDLKVKCTAHAFAQMLRRQQTQNISSNF